MLCAVLGIVDFGKSTYSSPKWSLACEQRVGSPSPGLACPDLSGGFIGPLRRIMRLYTRLTV